MKKEKDKQSRELKKMKRQTSDTIKIMIKTGENWNNIQQVANTYSSQLKTDEFKIKEENGKKVAKHKSPNLFMNDVRFDCDQADKETKSRYDEAQKYVLEAMITHIHNKEKDNNNYTELERGYQ